MAFHRVDRHADTAHWLELLTVASVLSVFFRYS